MSRQIERSDYETTKFGNNPYWENKTTYEIY